MRTKRPDTWDDMDAYEKLAWGIQNADLKSEKDTRKLQTLSEAVMAAALETADKPMEITHAGRTWSQGERGGCWLS